MTKALAPPTGDLVAREAQAWIGTEVIWGQAVKHRGADCKGLVRGVAAELGRPEADSFHGRFAAYPPDRAVPVQLLQEGLADLFDRVSGETQPGDLLLVRLNGAPQHLVIQTFDGRGVHAWSPKVKETRLAALFKEHPLHSAWRWRELA